MNNSTLTTITAMICMFSCAITLTGPQAATLKSVANLRGEALTPVQQMPIEKLPEGTEVPHTQHNDDMQEVTGRQQETQEAKKGNILELDSVQEQETTKQVQDTAKEASETTSLKETFGNWFW